MTLESAIRDAASGAFITAFLLSGDAERAEAAVLKSINAVDSEDMSGGDLLYRAVAAALQLSAPARTRKELEPAFLSLPPELQRVMQLLRHPRQCFVLRILLGLPREICARMLLLDDDQIDDGTCAAVYQLAAKNA